MKNIFRILLLIVVPLFLTDHAVAQVNLTEPSVGTSGNITPDIQPLYQGSTFFGQKHSYTVVFRGNGEAVVNARIVVGNSTEDPLKEVNLRIPGVQASGIYVFQIFKEKQCAKYNTPQYDSVTGRYPPSVCVEYREPDYYNDYSYYNVKYKKADFEYKNDTLTVKLPEGIAAEKSGAFFIYYRAVGYAKKNSFGAYDYTFETLQAEDSVRNLNVGLSTDSDLYMKGVTGKVNYRFNDVSASIMKLGSGGGGEMGAVASPALDSYVSTIGQGSINKSASNLSPLESYKVEGSYASSRAKLYGKEIMIGAIVTLVVIALFVVMIIAIVKLLKKSNPPVNKKDEVSEYKEKPLLVQPATSNGKMFAVIAILGFIVSLLMSVYTILVIVLGSLITKSVGYSYQSLVGIVLVIISILVYSLLVFSPGVLIGVKKGAGWGIGTVVSTVLWLIFWVVIIFLGLFLFGNSGGLYNIIQPLSGSVMY